MPNLEALPLRDDDGHVRVVVEAPRGSMAKLTYEPTIEAFTFGRALPLGLVYPYEWGFFPSTRADDGDPLDAMVIFEGRTAVGVVIPSVPIGVVRISQNGDAKGRVANDRVLCVPVNAPRYAHVRELPARTREELERFFLETAFETGKNVRVEGWEGPKAALRAIKKAERAWREKS